MVLNFIYIFIKIQGGTILEINAIKTTDIKHRTRQGEIFINNINDEKEHVIILSCS